MKKIFAILLSVMMLFGMLALTAFAETDETRVPVVIHVPEDWGTPSLWAWADDGTNAFAAWPGEEMDALAEGWYYTYVPAFVQNVIVNANQNTDKAVQTDAIVVEAGKEVWITVAEDQTTTVSYEAQLRGEIPAYVETFVVHAYVPLSWKTVNLWAWSAPDGTNAFESWPGHAMREGDNGWFTCKAPTWINSLIINGNEGTVQTEDISVEGKELWITVYEDLTYELSYEDPEKTAPDVTVHAQVPEDWTAPSLWAWSAPDGTNAFAAWPGEAMTQEGDWYTIQVPGWINSVIVNAKDGTIQTTDLSVETGKELWVVVTDAENAEVFYEEPAQISTPETTAAPETTAPAATEAPQQAKAGNTGVVIGVAAAVVLIGGGAAIAAKKKKG